MNDLTIVLRSLRVRLFSTVTTALTVGVAVALMLTLLMMKDSGRKSFDRGSGNTHMVISTDASPLTTLLNTVYYAGMARRPIPYQQFLQLRDRYAPADSNGFAIPIAVGDSYHGNPVVATTDEFFTRFQPVAEHPFKLREGNFIRGDFEVVVGAHAARDAGLALGDRIVLTHGSGGSRGGEGHVHDEFRYTVVGILEPTGSAHDRALFSNLQSAWLLHALDRLEREGKIKHDHEDHDEKDTDHKAGGQPHDAHDDHDDHDHHDHEPPVKPADLTDTDRLITGIYLRVPTREGRDASAGMQQVFDQLRRDPSITVAQPAQEITRLFSIVGAVDKVLIGMAAAVLLAGGVSILLAMYHSMEQRRRQIAIIRVLGASRARVFSLVLSEAAILGILGAALGVALALLGGRVVAWAMREQLGLWVEPVMPLDLTLAVAAGAIVLALVAGLLPAIFAYRSPVADNLRPSA